MQKRLFLFLFLMMLFGSFQQPSYGYNQSIKPKSYSSNKRYKFWIYRDRSTYYYAGFFRKKCRIEFDSTEKMDNAVITIDDPTWEVVRADNMLYLMPIDPEKSDTMMTVVTNKRSYAFELHAKEADSSLDNDVVIAYNFSYPNPKDGPGDDADNGSVISRYSMNTAPDLSRYENFSYNIKVSGDNTIKPVAAFHDGERTWLKLRDNDPEASTIFAVDKDGYEELVNFSVEGGYIVVLGVYKVLTMRSGPNIACVFNDDVK